MKNNLWFNAALAVSVASTQFVVASDNPDHVSIPMDGGLMTASVESPATSRQAFSHQQALQNIAEITGRLRRFFPDSGITMLDGEDDHMPISPDSRPMSPYAGRGASPTSETGCMGELSYLIGKLIDEIQSNVAGFSPRLPFPITQFAEPKAISFPSLSPTKPAAPSHDAKEAPLETRRPIMPGRSLREDVPTPPLTLSTLESLINAEVVRLRAFFTRPGISQYSTIFSPMGGYLELLRRVNDLIMAYQSVRSINLFAKPHTDPVGGVGFLPPLGGGIFPGPKGSPRSGPIFTPESGEPMPRAGRLDGMTDIGFAPRAPFSTDPF